MIRQFIDHLLRELIVKEDLINFSDHHYSICQININTLKYLDHWVFRRIGGDALILKA